MSDFTAIFSDSGGGFTPQMESVETFNVAVDENNSSEPIAMSYSDINDVTVDSGNSNTVVTKSEYDTGTGSNNYNDLKNIPTINGVSVVGDKQCEDYDIQREISALSNIELEGMLK